MSISDCLKRFNDPVWTTREVDRFWQVVEPYLKHLLKGDLPLPEHDVDFNKMNISDEKKQRRCMEHVHECMWKGRYSLAVANLKAIRQFFDGAQQNELIVPSVTDDHELRQLKRIFVQEPLRR